MIFTIKGFSDNFLHLYCYFHHVSADMSSAILQVFVGTREPSLNFELRPLLNPGGGHLFRIRLP